MATRNPRSWMWAEACELLAEGQRLQRQFFRFGQVAAAQPRWEPPVDVVAHDREVLVTFALPGVAPERIQVTVGHGVLRLVAMRGMPVNEFATRIHRLEIPYGRFERTIELPPGRFDVVEQAFVNGCLLLRLAPRSREVA